MQFEPLNIQRTEWKTKNIEILFEKVLPLFPQLLAEDISEIKNYIQTQNVDYFEVAHYKNSGSEQKDPSSILVISNDKVFYDIVDLDLKDELIENFKNLASDSGQFVKSRPITKSELKKRLMIFLEDNDLADFKNQIEMTGDLNADLDNDRGFSSAENDEVDYEADDLDGEPDGESFDFIEKDEFGHLDRAPIKVIAKQPVLHWLNECLKNEPPSKIPLSKFEWTLEKINSEPTVFLIPVGTELLPPKTALKFWRETKQRIFFEFLQGYYVDETYWPSYAGEAMFDQWFDIEMMGVIIDLVD